MADYVKKRTHIINHERFLAAGTIARDLYDWGMLWSGQQETDGEIPMAVVLLSPWGAGGKKNVTVAQKLVDVGLWGRTDNGYRILKWAEQGNVTKAELVAKRKADRDRKAKARGRLSESPSDDSVRADSVRSHDGIPSSSFTSPSGSGSREGVQGEIRPHADKPNPFGPKPPWWDDILAAIHMDCGVELPAGEAWIRYAGHRHGKSLPATREDAGYWLGGVMVPEAKEKLRRESHQRERDAKFDADRASRVAFKDPLELTAEQQADLAKRHPMPVRKRSA